MIWMNAPWVFTLFESTSFEQTIQKQVKIGSEEETQSKSKDAERHFERIDRSQEMSDDFQENWNVLFFQKSFFLSSENVWRWFGSDVLLLL